MNRLADSTELGYPALMSDAPTPPKSTDVHWLHYCEHPDCTAWGRSAPQDNEVRPSGIVRSMTRTAERGARALAGSLASFKVKGGAAQLGRASDPTSPVQDP